MGYWPFAPTNDRLGRPRTRPRASKRTDAYDWFFLRPLVGQFPLDRIQTPPFGQYVWRNGNRVEPRVHSVTGGAGPFRLLSSIFRRLGLAKSSWSRVRIIQRKLGCYTFCDGNKLFSYPTETRRNRSNYDFYSRVDPPEIGSVSYEIFNNPMPGMFVLKAIRAETPTDVKSRVK